MHDKLARLVIPSPLFMKKLLLISTFLLIFSACTSEEAPITTETTDVVPERVTLTGTYLCLPHKVQSEFQTLECALGMQTADGKYYAVDFGLSSNSEIEPEMNEEFTASGVLTPVEMLSSDHWQNYPIEGIFSITVRTD